MAEKIELAAPVVKWAGGKRQLLEEILPLLPREMPVYCEPFLGGGAVLLAVQPQRALVNAVGADLITVYRVIRDNPDGLIAALRAHQNTADYFYAIRSLDRDREAYEALSPVEKASRLIYLNKTCYNGLFRVNASGAFNVPFGRCKNPNIVNEPVLRAVSEYFQSAQVELYSEDFAQTLQRLPSGGFAYLDPPYDPVSGTASFTGYSKGGFGREEQRRLKACCDALTGRGVRFMLSNSATDFIKDLYRDYHIVTVRAKRAINAKASLRGEIEEVLITNYESP